VGGGNAALCAALMANEHGARVIVLERAPAEERGGNSAYAGGSMRIVYRGAEDIYRVVSDLTPEEKANSDFGEYTVAEYLDAMYELTQYRTDPDLAEVLVKDSFEAVSWMHGKGIRFEPSYGRHAPNVNGKFKFYGGSTLRSAGGGRGLVDSLFAAAQRYGIEVRYQAEARQLLHDDNGVHGVRVRIDGRTTDIGARAVVLACGGFESSAEWRARYLGAGWDLAKVRGTRYNTGDGLRMALEAGAQPCGNWTGCHATEWDINAPEYGDYAVGDGFNKHSYHYGIIINRDGRRYVDEGADIRSFTYAKYGKVILTQPGQAVWQVFDSKVTGLLRASEYNSKYSHKVTAATLPELAQKLGREGVNEAGFLKTVTEFNAAVRTGVTFNPSVKDGRGTDGLEIPKSNWAQAIIEPPLAAYAVTCGITFTFGGLKITTDAQVLDTGNKPLRGLYCAGEMVGGLFYDNYPGGSGLVSGSVFGRRAGKGAALYAKTLTGR
jgi:tricarballylate dehydrogenase